MLLSGCMNDSAGKFCPDKWTREGEEGKVEEKGHEEIPHEDEKEDQDVAARPTARSHSRSDQPNSSGEFSEKRRGDWRWSPSCKRWKTSPTARPPRWCGDGWIGNMRSRCHWMIRALTPAL